MLSKLNEVDRVTIMHLNSFCIRVATVWSFLKISMRFSELFSKDTGDMSLHDIIQINTNTSNIFGNLQRLGICICK